MKWMKPEFDYTFFGGKGGFIRCWPNIGKGGYLMMMLDYKGGRGVKNLGKSDYVIRERSLTM